MLWDERERGCGMRKFNFVKLMQPEANGLNKMMHLWIGNEMGCNEAHYCNMVKLFKEN